MVASVLFLVAIAFFRSNGPELLSFMPLQLSGFGGARTGPVINSYGPYRVVFPETRWFRLRTHKKVLLDKSKCNWRSLFLKWNGHGDTCDRLRAVPAAGMGSKLCFTHWHWHLRAWLRKLTTYHFVINGWNIRMVVLPGPNTGLK